MSISNDIKKEQEEAGQLKYELRSILEQNQDGFNDDVKAKYDDIASRYAKKVSRLEVLQRQADLDTSHLGEMRATPNINTNVVKRGRATTRDFNQAFRATAITRMGQGNDVPSEWRTSCEKVGINPNSANFDFRFAPEGESEVRTDQNIGTAIDGGNLTSVDNTLMSDIVKYQKWYGGIRNYARVIRSETGSDMPYPTMNDTGNVAGYHTENTAPTSVPIEFSKATIKSKLYDSAILPVSKELLMDSLCPIESIIAEAIGERLGRKQNTDFTVGSGSGEVPQGIVTGSLYSGVTAAATSTLNWKEIVKFIGKVDPAYRNSPNFMLLTHDQTYFEMLTMEDDNGRPLYARNLTDSPGTSWFGYKVGINNDMPTIAAGAKVLLAGDFQKAFVIRDVRGVTVSMLTERYAELLAIGFIGYARAGSKVVCDAAVKHLLMAAS